MCQACREEFIRSEFMSENKEQAHLSRNYDPDYIYDRDYAKEKPQGKSFPRWMDSFSKVDMFGKPTVFSKRFMK